MSRRCENRSDNVLARAIAVSTSLNTPPPPGFPHDYISVTVASDAMPGAWQVRVLRGGGTTRAVRPCRLQCGKTDCVAANRISNNNPLQFAPVRPPHSPCPVGPCFQWAINSGGEHFYPSRAAWVESCRAIWSYVIPQTEAVRDKGRPRQLGCLRNRRYTTERGRWGYSLFAKKMFFHASFFYVEYCYAGGTMQ